MFPEFVNLVFIYLQAIWEGKVDRLKALTLELLDYDGDKYLVEVDSCGEVCIVEKV